MSSVPLSASTGVTALGGDVADLAPEASTVTAFAPGQEPGPRRFVALKALLRNLAAVLGALILLPFLWRERAHFRAGMWPRGPLGTTASRR